MKNNENLYWIAVCVGFNEENGKILASALTFWARNRFYALQAIAAMLPENEAWVMPDGKTRPYQLYTLEQSKPEESDEKIIFYLQTFSDILEASRLGERIVA